MKVRYEGTDVAKTVWKDGYKSRCIVIKSGDEFQIEDWGDHKTGGKFKAVVTSDGEWICDVESKEFEENFK